MSFNEILSMILGDGVCFITPSINFINFYELKKFVSVALFTQSHFVYHKA